jgi:hypothetical protein
MIKEAIDRILDLAAPTKIEVGGKTYADKHMYLVREPLPLQPNQPVALPVPTFMKVTTLAGFADLVQQKLEKFEVSDYVVHVLDHNTVRLVKKYSDECGRRQVLIEAKPVEFKQFEFDKWLGQESFVIALNALFSQTDDKDYVLRIASALTTEAANISEDDGHSQRVTIKAGLAQKVNETIKPQVKLAPYRTFPECGQPISEFVFRARPGETPTLMLTEADGGKWKIAAIEEVRRFLSVLELSDLPIVS